MAFEAIVRGGGLLTQGFGQTPFACSCRCEWNCPGRSSCPSGFHAGIDIAARDSAVLTAVGYGRVTRIGRLTSGCGGLGPYAVCVRSGSVDIWYGHARRDLVAVGAQVVPGQAIALMGSVGCSTGTHVHYEVLPAGQDPSGCTALDPWAYVSKWPGKPVAPPAPAPPPKPRLRTWMVLGAAGALIYAGTRAGGRL